jgi:hypothetical protein
MVFTSFIQKDIPTAEIGGQTLTLVFDCTNTLGSTNPIKVPLADFNPLHRQYIKVVSATLKDPPSALPAGSSSLLLAWNGATKIQYAGAAPGTKSTIKELDRIYLPQSGYQGILLTSDEHFRPLGSGVTTNIEFWLAKEDGTDIIALETEIGFKMVISLLVF